MSAFFRASVEPPPHADLQRRLQQLLSIYGPTRCLLLATCYLPLATCHLPLGHLLLATCHLPLATCYSLEYLPLATCYSFTHSLTYLLRHVLAYARCIQLCIHCRLLWGSDFPFVLLGGQARTLHSAYLVCYHRLTGLRNR